MKTSIPRIKTVTPKKFEMSAVRKQLGEHIDHMFSHLDSPVVAYALVTFHSDGAYSCSTAVTPKMLPHLVDIPELAGARLREHVINRLK